MLFRGLGLPSVRVLFFTTLIFCGVLIRMLSFYLFSAYQTQKYIFIDHTQMKSMSVYKSRGVNSQQSYTCTCMVFSFLSTQDNDLLMQLSNVPKQFYPWTTQKKPRKRDRHLYYRQRVNYVITLYFSSFKQPIHHIIVGDPVE